MHVVPDTTSQEEAEDKQKKTAGANQPAAENGVGGSPRFYDMLSAIIGCREITLWLLPKMNGQELANTLLQKCGEDGGSIYAGYTDDPARFVDGVGFVEGKFLKIYGVSSFLPFAIWLG